MDTSRRHSVSWAALLVVAAGVILFTLFASLSRYNLDRYGDMLENYGWGIGWQLGYTKHPPLFGWITAAFFSIAPRTDSAYFLLSALNGGLAILFVLLASTRFLDHRRQAGLVVIAYLIPALGFMAIKYNANSAMLPFWAGCLLFYLRLIERRKLSDAVLLGLFGGLAMLAKYHSVVLIATFALFTLWDRDTRNLLRTPLPWIASAVAIVVFLPHVAWLFRNDFITLTYAAEQGETSLLGLLDSIISFSGAFFARLALPLLYLCLFWRRPGGFPFTAGTAFAGLAASMQGRAVLAAATGPGLLTIVLAVAMDAPLTETWSIPCAIPFPILFAAMLPSHLFAERSRRALWFPVVVAVAILAVAPSIRSGRFGGVEHYEDFPVRDAAAEVTRRFQDAFDRPLRIVGGEPVLAYGVAFYGQGQIYAVAGADRRFFPWVGQDAMERDGAAYVCVNRPIAACRAGAMVFLGRVDLVSSFVSGPTPAIIGARPFAVAAFFRKPRETAMRTP